MRRQVVLVVAVAVVIAVIAGVRGLRRARSPAESRFDPRAAALARYEEVQGEGVDLSRGPCLGIIGPDWVADVAHDPREPVDDDLANQCAEYREGSAKHFVELTPEGTVIRVR